MLASGSTVFYLLALAASLMQHAASQGTQTHSLVVCEGSKGNLGCPPNTLIEINSVFYGRTSHDYCPFGPRQTLNCAVDSSRAMSIARDRCQGRRACELMTQAFGDPCVGTTKYLLVTYTCRELHTAVACDDTGSLKIQCPAGRYIHVRDGFYGRASDDYCNHGPRHDYRCSQPNAQAIIAGSCDNRQECTVPLNSQGDPCPGTLKYMTAGFECLDHRVQVACDGALMSLSCPPGQVIQLRSGFYGRRSDEFCGHGPRLTYNCSAAQAANLIASWCNAKPSCQFQLNQFGDPCPNTLKMADRKSVV